MIHVCIRASMSACYSNCKATGTDCYQWTCCPHVIGLVLITTTFDHLYVCVHVSFPSGCMKGISFPLLPQSAIPFTECDTLLKLLLFRHDE